MKDLLKYLETQKGKTKLPFIAGDEQFSSNPTDSYKKVYARRFMQDTQEPHGGTREINKNEFPSMLEA